MTVAGLLSLLAVDDEPPALDELAYLLRADPRVGHVHLAADAVAALKVLEAGPVDGVFLDIRMPGLSGLELARVLGRFAAPPPVVFVTAHDDAAVEAFSLRAVDYLLKPVRGERLREAVSRVAEAQAGPAGGGQPPADPGTIAVELGGVTRFLQVAEVRHVEAQGDYARLHTATGSHLVRVPLAALEERWAAAGFVRVHRSYLVSTGHISELRVEPGGGHSVRVGEGGSAVVLPVSRRLSRDLKDRLVQRARREAER
ncbi:MAG TPA: LytTR family DNA-binding domain-containing protein [Mycobacteriales bacterium]|nr:LytTR family DNA-binding domain-containing protein [Mycobacteriales bacterium]